MSRNNNNYDVIIIGGGASGLLCAAALNMKNPAIKVLVIEKNGKPGRKLLATGNGRCNFTNKNITSAVYNTDDKDKLQRILDVYTFEKIIEVFSRDLGIIPAYKGDLVYPITYQSKTVCEALAAACASCDMLYDTEVISVKREGLNYIVNGTYSALYVVFACGGVSLPDSGSNGSLYPVLRSFTGNASFEKLLPSLVPLKTSDKDLKRLSGIRQECTVTLDGVAEQGEILFTDYGISGICVMQLSGIYNRAVSEGKRIDAVYVDLIPSMNDEQKLNTIKKLINRFPERKPEDAIAGLLKKPLAKCVVARSDGSCESIASVIGNFRITLNGSLGFENAQVTSGGVKLSSLTESLEAVESHGVFVCGEAVNVDGLCGGYNLHWAWSSALLVSDAILDLLEVD